MGRIARSWRMAKQSYRLLMKDKELMLLPLISGICIMAVLASFVFGMGIHKYDEAAFETQSSQIKLAVMAFLFYVASYTIAFFFQAALVAGALERMRGGDPTLGSALGAASKRFGSLLMWGIVAATVGMILRSIQERSEMVGKIVAGLLGAAWTLATFFVVPVLVMERMSIGASFKESARLFKETWGETISGNIGFGLLGFLLMLPVAGIAYAIATANPLIGAIVGLVGFAAVGVFMSALQGVFVASLYRYAKDKQSPGGFAEGELAQVFA